MKKSSPLFLLALDKHHPRSRSALRRCDIIHLAPIRKIGHIVAAKRPKFGIRSALGEQ